MLRSENLGGAVRCDLIGAAGAERGCGPAAPVQRRRAAPRLHR
jgi:hypothetical protein